MKKKIIIPIILILATVLIAGTVLILSHKGTEKTYDINDPVRDQVMNRALISDLRSQNSLMNITLNDLAFFKNYTAEDQRLLIYDEEKTEIDLQLTSPHAVSGLIASPDTKLFEWTLYDVGEARKVIFDDASFFDIKDNYKRVDREVWFKYGVDKEVCYEDLGCNTATDWYRFNSLDELPKTRPIKISMWASTKPLESIEFVPKIDGFDVLEWASFNISEMSYAGNYTFGNGLIPGGARTDSVGLCGTNYLTLLDYNGNMTQHYCSDLDNVTTCSWTGKSKKINTFTTAYYEHRWNAAGTKLFYGNIEDAHGEQFEMHCSTPCDPTSCINVDYYDANAVLLQPSGSTMGHDGYYFLYGQESGSPCMVYQFNMTYFENVSDVNYYDKNMSCSTWTTHSRGQALSSNGAHFALLDVVDRDVHYFQITQPGNINSSIYKDTVDVGTYETTPEGNIYNDEGTRYLMVGRDKDAVFMFTMFSSDVSPTVTLNSPANAYNTTSSSISFNCSASDDTQVDNVTLVLDTVSNYTVIGGVSNFTELNVTLNIAEGDHNWYCKADDNTGHTGSVGSRSFRIDQTDPVVTILNPLNNSIVMSPTTVYNVSLNVSVSDNLGLKNCSYFNGTANTSITCGNNATIQLAAGYHNLTYYAYDAVGHLGSATTTFLVNYYSYSVMYDPTVIEQTSTVIGINLTATKIYPFLANLSYNGSLYNLTGTNTSTNLIYNVTVIAPQVSAESKLNFTIFYAMQGTSGNTGNTSQTIYNIPDLVIQASPCSDLAINFSLVDEANFTQLNGTFEYNFVYGTQSNSTYTRKYGEIASSKNFYVCINSTISNNWSLGQGEIFYTSNGYVDRRYYLFSNTSLTNHTNNITLYDLVSSDQTSFKLEVEDTSLNPYADKYTTLVRWYPDLNEYNVVDMGKTDETGSTVIHVRTEDVDYRIGVYQKDGTLIKLADPIRMVCLVTPCTYTLRISPTDTDYTSFLNVDYTFAYNSSLGLWTFVWTDTTQTTSKMNLTVYKITGTSVYSVCSNEVTGYAGAVTCNTSLYSGTLKGVVERSASPGVPITEKIIETATTAFRSSYGLFLGLLIGIPIIFIFAFMSPIGAVIGGIVALIPSLYFGAITWTVLGGIAILAGIILHFLKRIG